MKELVAELLQEKEEAITKLVKELTDTKNKLDRAIWWLNEIVENHRFTPISTAEKALKELNQKEEQ